MTPRSIPVRDACARPHRRWHQPTGHRPPRRASDSARPAQRHGLDSRSFSAAAAPPACAYRSEFDDTLPSSLFPSSYACRLLPVSGELPHFVLVELVDRVDQIVGHQFGRRHRSRMTPSSGTCRYRSGCRPGRQIRSACLRAFPSNIAECRALNSRSRSSSPLHRCRPPCRQDWPSNTCEGRPPDSRGGRLSPWLAPART